MVTQLAAETPGRASTKGWPPSADDGRPEDR